MQSGQLTNGRYIALSGNEEIVMGAQYELRGTIPWEIVAVLPDSWVEYAIAEIFSIQHDEFDVLGAEVNAEGSIRIRVIAKHNSPVLIIAGAIVVGLIILAGMKIEQMYQVVFGSPGNPPTALQSVTSIVTILAIAGGVYLVWSMYRGGGSS
jgi:hypothetical protein